MFAEAVSDFEEGEWFGWRITPIEYCCQLQGHLRILEEWAWSEESACSCKGSLGRIRSHRVCMHVKHTKYVQTWSVRILKPYKHPPQFVLSISHSLCYDSHSHPVSLNTMCTPLRREFVCSRYVPLYQSPTECLLICTFPASSRLIYNGVFLDSL